MAKTYTVIYKKLKTRREVRTGSQSGPFANPFTDPVYEDIEYQISIDWGAATKLALKAASNRSGKSKMGPILVEVTSAKCGVGV
jgi:hypothetical protein